MSFFGKRRRDRRGQVMIEFVLVSGFLWAPLIFLMMTVGFRLVRAVELVELANDVSQMFARGVDFSTTSNQNLLVNQLASTFGLQGNGANAITGGSSGPMAIVLSQYFYVNSADPSCTASCVNQNSTVLERRIIVGNAGLIGTGGTPTSVGTILSSDLNTTTGTCEQGDSNLPPPTPGTPTTCQYTDANVTVSAGAFSRVMSNLPTNIGGNVGGTAFYVEVYFRDLAGRMTYQRSID